MEPQTTPSSAITRAFSSTRQQLQNALDNLNNQEAFAFSAVTQFEYSSVDEYNAAITQAEEFQAEAESLRVQLHVIKDKQGEFECVGEAYELIKRLEGGTTPPEAD